MIEITINGEKRKIIEGASLLDLIDVLDLPAVRIAVEVNKYVVRKQDWTKKTINESDEVEIVHFVGGG